MPPHSFRAPAGRTPAGAPRPSRLRAVLARLATVFGRPIARFGDGIARPGHLAQFLGYYRPHLPLLAADLACAAVVAATAVAVPVATNLLMGRLLTAPDAPTTIGWVLATGAALLAIVVVSTVAEFFVDHQGHVMGARIEAAVRHQLFEHCQKLSFGFYDRQRTGQLMSHITNDTFWLGELFHHGPEDVAIAVLKYAGAMAVVLSIDPPLAAVILALTPAAIAYALHFNGRMNAAVAAGRDRIAAVNARVEDALAGIRVVQSFAGEAAELRRFAALNRDFLDSRADSYRAEAWFSVGMQAFAQLVTVIVVVLGGLRIAAAALTVAELMTVLMCVAVLVDPVKRLANVVRLWQEGYTGFVRAMAVLAIAPDITDRPNARPLPPPAGEIRFDNVGFRYGADRAPVFERLSFTIAPGEFVAVVGPSGAGKSTLAALVPRFYDVGAGAVRIDGVDVRDVTLASLRRHIGTVAQDTYLFAGTVADNLRYGRPEASDAEVEAAAHAAHADVFIRALPQGYQTDIGQRGVRLSGGQRQRLAIARAILKDPAILIFDEATSALDNDSERAVQAALFALAKGRTTLVIAHRLSTVRRADRILVLTGDGLVEQGRHDDLVAADGVYAGLHRLHASI